MPSLCGYKEDNFFKLVIDGPEKYGSFFTERDGILFHSTDGVSVAACIPDSLFKGRRVRELVISHYHETLGHLGFRKTLAAIRTQVWWPSIHADTSAFCKSCTTCAMIKSSTQAPLGLAHPLPVPRAPWEVISMDFVGPFPPSHGLDYLWVIVDKLTSMVRLVPTTTRVTAKELAKLFLDQVWKFHGLPNTIISDRDSKFVSRFWREIHRLLGTKLLMSTAYHPQTDGSLEQAIHTISSILRAFVSSDQTDWSKKLPQAEFAINSTVSVTTGHTPFELNYGYTPSSLRLVATEVSFPGVRAFAEQARVNLMRAHDAIIESRTRSTARTNSSRCEEKTPFKEGDLVYLSTENLALPKGRARKLSPKFIGPFRSTEARPESSNYKLALPPDLGRIHPKFHSSLLRPYVPNDDENFPARDSRKAYDFAQSLDQEWFINEIVGHEWRDNSLFLFVQWTAGGVTPEPLSGVEDTEALDRYLELMGVATPRRLPRRREGH